MEIKKPTLKNFEPSTTIMQQHHKMNSKEIFNHRYKNLRNMKAEDDDYDFPTALPSHGTAPNAQNLKFFVLDPPENRHDPSVIISPSANIMGARASPYTAAQSGELRNGYGSKLLSSGERTAPPQRLNRIPPPIPAVKNYAFNNDSFEELGKTKYWTSSGKKLGKKKPYHGPKKADRAESKRIKMTIRPKNEITVKVTKMPFIIKA